MRATVARLGREAAWLSPQQGIGSCLHAATAVGASRACLGADVVRTVAMCVYGQEAAVLFEQ